ncbi:MAG TPA: efflux RND transporter permease subunit [Candidatus Cybelea sp.]|nr:efflux RND transporter permease subunit [Candidatus Cybelea sp.]
MRFTDVFIKRPVFAIALNLLLVIAGLAALASLQIRQFPRMQFTVITVTTVYTGASADLVQGFVTQPMQEQIAAADGVDYLTSESRSGTSVITVYMRLNYPSSAAQSNILAKIQAVRADLPKEIEDPKLDISSGDITQLIYFALSSDQMDSAQITDYAKRVIQPKFSTVAGVSKIKYYGDREFAMRVWLDPRKLAVYQITAAQVRNAISNNNYQTTAGQVRGEYNSFDIDAQTGLEQPDDFGAIIVATGQNGIVRLRDVAQISLGAKEADVVAKVRGKPAVFIGIDATPEANPLNVANGLKALLPDIERNLPVGLKMQTAYDTSIFIEESIKEVEHTIIEAAVIVTVVIFMFIGSLRAIAVPIIALPLSIIGVAVFLAALGFSINLLTLLAIVLAIGLVVDDAIVVLENVDRHMKTGKSSFLAAIAGTREIAVPVISMTVTLAAVYAPIAFTPGISGALFSEFALTLAGSVFISGFVALTLSPVLCAMILKSSGKPGVVQRVIEHMLERMDRGYNRLLDGVLKFRIVVLIFGALVFASLFPLFGMIKSELAPSEDQGAIMVQTIAPAGVNPDYQEFYHDRVSDALAKVPDIGNWFTLAGTPTVRQGTAVAVMKPWHDRTVPFSDSFVVARRELNKVVGLKAAAFSLPPLPGSGGGFPMQFVISTTDDYKVLTQVMARVEQRAKTSGLFAFTDVDLKFENPTVVLTVDRDKAGAYGISMSDIGTTWLTMVSNGYVNRMSVAGRSYRVIPQTPRIDRLTPDDLTSYYVTASDGFPVPLSNLVDAHTEIRPISLTQMNQLNAATLSAALAPGVTMGQAVAFLEDAARQEMPRGFGIDYKGESRQFVKEGSSLAVTFVMAIFVIFLVLASQFESWRDPLVIMVSVPLAISGALLPLAAGWMTLNIYSQVGLITLVGLITKHGILICEVAREKQEKERVGKRQAVLEAATQRLRPILMTTAAMVAGLVPLLAVSGAGAASRFSIGIVIVCGLTIGTLFTLFVLPSIYTFLASDHSKAVIKQEDRDRQIGTIEG